MTIQTHYDNAMLRGPRSVPLIQRLGGGTLATVGDSQPFRVVGQQAVVYQLRQATGKVLALRGWLTDQIDPDVVARYRAIAGSDLLKRGRSHDHSPLVGSIAYHADAIMIEADDPHAMSRPLVVLDWLMGPTVLAAVDRACRANDGAYLNALASAWRVAMLSCRELGFVHGDLTAENAIVRPKEGIALVDYDTAYWPDSPSVPLLNPAPAYRHPKGAAKDPRRADDYAAFLIYSSLRVLAVWPELRVEHGQPATVKGAGLLFQPRDLSSPDGSALFGKTRVINDPDVLGLVSVLREISLAPGSDIPDFVSALELADHVARTNPTGSIPKPVSRRKPSIVGDVALSERVASSSNVDSMQAPIEQQDAEQAWPLHQKVWNPDSLADLADSIASGDLSRAELAWTSVSNEPGASALLPALYVLREHANEPLEDESETRSERRSRLRKDQIRVSLAGALDRNDSEALADLALSGDLDEIDDLTIASTKQVVASLAVRHLERAIESDDDTLILDAYDESIMAIPGVLTELQQNRVDQAFDRRTWLQDVRAALRAKDRGRIDRLFALMPSGANDRLTKREQVRITRLQAQDDAVQALEYAAERKDGAELVHALQQVERLGAWMPAGLVWSEILNVVDRQTLTDAITSAAGQEPRDYGRLGRLLPQLKDACGGRLPDPAGGLDFMALDREVRQISQVARLREALVTNDDRQIVAAALPDLYGIIPLLDRGEQARIERAVAAASRALRRSGQRMPMTAASSSTVETR